MQVAEEPFLTRESILSVLKPGGANTERPFRTLRERRAASEGFSVYVRTLNGHMVGRLYLYSSLNGDAARAYRLNQTELARKLAKRANRLERTPWAKLLRRAVEEIASRLPADPRSTEAPPSLRRYFELRRRSTWHGLDQAALTREWLAHSSAWLDVSHERRATLLEAIKALSEEAQKARNELIGNEIESVSTFYGVVRRMDSSAAELEADSGEALILPRQDLERQGLAVLGQAVSLLREILPSGGSYCLPMPAVVLENSPDARHRASPWQLPDEDGVIRVDKLGERDSEWLSRELAREPTAVPAAPLSIQ